MKLIETRIPGVVLLEPEPIQDPRGYFAECFNVRALQAAGLDTGFLRANQSFNHSAGTLRGLHAQRAPFAEDKLVRCLQGAIFDVAVDLRPDSPAFGQWVGEELSAENSRMLYVPKGCAHGYLTLTDAATVFYLVTGEYHPEAEMGLRWDDPDVAIAWPEVADGVRLLSDKDQRWPLLDAYRPAAAV